MATGERVAFIGGGRVDDHARASKRLHEQLRHEPWFTMVGMGTDEKGRPLLIVYGTPRGNKRPDIVPTHVYEIPVYMRRSGKLRPAADPQHPRHHGREE